MSGLNVFVWRHSLHSNFQSLHTVFQPAYVRTGLFISNNTVIILWSLLRPPCEVIVLFVLPAFRSMVARSLMEKWNFSQVAVAKKRGTSQASISHYLYSKRGEKMVKQLEASTSVQPLVDEIAEGIATDKISPFDATLRFCRLCEVLRSGDLICNYHKGFITVPKTCNVCSPMEKKH